MADGDAFDMFAAEEPFSAKLLRAASSFDVEPAVVYAALIVGVSIEATVIAELLSLSNDSETIGGEAMADGMKFVISSLPEATVEELEEIIGAVIDAADGDHAALLTDPMSVVSRALSAEDDEEFEDALSDAGEESDGGSDGSPSDEDEESRGGSEGSPSDESEDEIDPADFRETVKAKISAWDDWIPEDEVLRSLKVSFAETCVAALEHFPPADDF